MIWNSSMQFFDAPFELESELEQAIVNASPVLFGKSRVFLPIKRRIGEKGKVQNIPDGYLIDLSSAREPRLFVVEIELAIHDPLKHIAVQILEFSLSFETSQRQIKNILKTNLAANAEAWAKCQKYVSDNNYDNIDVFLERITDDGSKFNALVIIDELDDDLERVLRSRFRFPVETLTFKRYRDKSGQAIYQFEPFLGELDQIDESDKIIADKVDISEVDTVVVPAQEDGFIATFLGENCWYAIRIHASMLSRIKYLATYRVAPESAITHLAKVHSIEPWRDSNKYIVIFEGPAEVLKTRIPLVPKGKVKAPQNLRYTSLKKLQAAKNLDEAF